MSERTNDDNMEAVILAAAERFAQFNGKSIAENARDVRTVIEWDRRHAVRGGMTIMSQRMAKFIREEGENLSLSRLADGLHLMAETPADDWGAEA